MAYETVGTIVNDAAKQLGYLTADESDVYGSTNDSVLRLTVFLKRLGRKLCRRTDWPQLKRAHTITTTTATTYALPTGFLRMVSGTAWNRTQRRRLIFASPQKWEELKASVSTGIDTQLTYQLADNLIEFLAAQTSGETLAFKYAHELWVGATLTFPGTLDAPTDHDHYCLFDSDMLIAGLVLMAKTEDGMDTTSALAEFQDAMAHALAGNDPGESLSLSGSEVLHLIDASNVSDTGYGS